MKKKTKRFGFTLIELLVVISIIAMLLSILMPALGKVRKSAQAIVCATRLKQVGVALELYAQQYKNFYPPCSINDGTPQQMTWDMFLMPYLPTKFTIKNPGGDVYATVEGTNIFHCPGDKIVRVNNSAPRSYSRIVPDNPPYTTNGAVLYHLPINRLKVVSPSTRFVISERHCSPNIVANNWYSLSYWQLFLASLNRASPHYLPNISSFHGRYSNYLFFDGHVDGMSLEEVNVHSLWRTQ